VVVTVLVATVFVIAVWIVVVANTVGFVKVVEVPKNVKVVGIVCVVKVEVDVTVTVLVKTAVELENAVATLTATGVVAKQLQAVLMSESSKGSSTVGLTTSRFFFPSIL